MQRVNGRTRMQLGEGTRILLNGRVGEVYMSTLHECHVIWGKYKDATTSEVVDARADTIKADVLERALSRGNLKILTLPTHLAIKPPENPAALAPRPNELERASWRDCYISAAQSLIDTSELSPYLADFDRYLYKIVDLGLQGERKRLEARTGPKRAGQKLTLSAPPKCAKTVFNWWKKFNAEGHSAAFDRYRASGNRSGRFTEEDEALMREVIGKRLTEERPSIASIVESVQSAFGIYNRQLIEADPFAEKRSVPGYDAVWSMIAAIAPIDHAIRTRGMNVAYRDLHTIGQGLKITRALERVELDEYTVDLMVFLRIIKLFGLMTPSEQLALGLTGAPHRVTLSMAIDVYTGAIVALQVAPAGSMNLTVKTIEMIYVDKQPIADAVGAQYSWPMHGHPQTLALDRAGVNISDEIYLRLSAAGITNLAVPAGKPFLKPWIEGFFATMGAKFLQQFTGRTFSDVVLKGENDPAKRATLTLEAFLEWLVRWIVDVHHTSKPRTLGRSAPLIEWERATAEIPPLVLVDESRLRKAFGDSHERLVSRKGLQVHGLHYVSQEIAEWFLNEPERKLEVWWWHKRIGRIEVLLPNGNWVTAHCKDEQWADKSYDDLAVFVAQDKATREFGQEARDDYRVAADDYTAKHAALRGILPLAPSAADSAARTKEFTRYLHDPNSELGPAPGIFDVEVTPSEQSSPLTEMNENKAPLTPNRPDIGDIME